MWAATLWKQDTVHLFETFVKYHPGKLEGTKIPLWVFEILRDIQTIHFGFKPELIFFPNLTITIKLPT